MQSPKGSVWQPKKQRVVNIFLFRLGSKFGAGAPLVLHVLACLCYRPQAAVQVLPNEAESPLTPAPPLL